MSPDRLLWLGAAGLGVIGLVLLIRKDSTTSKSSTTIVPTYGETVRVALPVPAGWRRVTNAEVTPELRAQAAALQSTPSFASMAYGALAPFTVADSRTYATWIEQHYHEPGGALRPWGLHHGVTLLARGGIA
jgi:hypothetical protein